MGGSAYQPRMASNPTTAPDLFDRALLRARQARALQLGAATFLLDRVAEDMAERLHAVLREFKTAADIGTDGEQLRNALAGRVDRVTRIASARTRIRAAGAGAGIARPRGIRAGAFSSSTICRACWRRSAAR